MYAKSVAKCSQLKTIKGGSGEPHVLHFQIFAVASAELRDIVTLVMCLFLAGPNITGYVERETDF
jgi:hypothetical protein